MLPCQQNSPREPAVKKMAPGRFVLLTLVCCAGWLVIYAIEKNKCVDDVVLTAAIIMASVACVFLMRR